MAAIGSQGGGKKFCSDPNIEVLMTIKSVRKLEIVYKKTYGVLAVAVRGTFTLFSRDLHETLLTSATDGRWIAAAFLHRERRKHDRRN